MITDKYLKDRILAVGLLYPTSMGMQTQATTVFRLQNGKYIEGEKCGHTCLTEFKGFATGGNYDCGASAVLQTGLKGDSLPPASQIIKWGQYGADGLRLWMANFLSTKFAEFCEFADIPEKLKLAYFHQLESGGIEQNWFGGDTEIHPELPLLVEWSLNQNMPSAITATGRRFLTDPEYLPALIKNTPTVMAFSLDEITDADDLKRLLSLSREQLAEEWQAFLKKNPFFGQRQKVYEAIHAARVIEASNLKTSVLFNMVLHNGNLRSMPMIIRLLSEAFPDAECNPYPGSYSFNRQPASFKLADLADFRAFVEWIIDQHLAGNPHISKRIHIWLKYLSIFETWHDDLPKIVEAVAGNDVWRCYGWPNRPLWLAPAYLQIGGDSDVAIPSANGEIPPWKKEPPVYAGGHKSCYWAPGAVNSPTKIQGAYDVNEYLSGEIQHLGYRHNEPNCRGCNMGRLEYHHGTSISGLNPLVVPHFIRLHKYYLPDLFGK